jgi:diguanylate cyclase (GGDEF)-like protein
MPDLIDQLADLTQLRDVEALDSALCHLTQRHMPLSHVAIHRLVEEGGSRRWLTGAQRGDALHPTAGTLGSTDLPSLDERPLWRDCLVAGRPQQLPGTPHQTLFPITDNSGTQGVMEIHSDAPLTEAHCQLMASLLGFQRQLRGLIDDNERDSLTGLLNRKSFDESFVRAAMAIEDDSQPEPPAAELDEPDRRGLPSVACHWLAVVDIDHFKRVNDQYGHLIGDEVLLLVAQLMRRAFRHGDRIYRFGGEEFLVLLRCPNTDSARVAFERLRVQIGVHDFPQVGHLTVSIGYTAIHADDTPGLAIERADLALYKAKSEGRDRTIAHADLVLARTTDATRGELEFF